MPTDNMYITNPVGGDAMEALPSYCVECRSNLFANLPGELTEGEMRQCLGRHGEAPVHLPASATYAEVWQTYLLYTEKATTAYAERIGNVMYCIRCRLAASLVE